MTTLSEVAFVDANIIIYAAYSESEHFVASRQLLSDPSSSDETLAVNSQVLAECYAVITDDRRVQPAYEPDEAAAVINSVVAQPNIEVLPTSPDVVDHWLTLATKHSIVRSDIHDAQIVATMAIHGIDRIYTFNRGFERFSQLRVFQPPA